MHTRASNKANKSKACQEMADRYPSMAGSNLEDANTMQADSLQRLDEARPGGDQDPDVFATVLTCDINLKTISVKASITLDIAFLDFNDIIL